MNEITKSETRLYSLLITSPSNLISLTLLFKCNLINDKYDRFLSFK